MKRIIRNKLAAEDLHKISVEPQLKKDAAPEASLNRVIRDFEVYGQIICAIAPPIDALSLQQALADYRIKLSLQASHYTYESLVEHHLQYVQNRMYKGATDPANWRQSDSDIAYMLISKQLRPQSVYKPGQLQHCYHPR